MHQLLSNSQMKYSDDREARSWGCPLLQADCTVFGALWPYGAQGLKGVLWCVKKTLPRTKKGGVRVAYPGAGLCRRLEV